MRIEFENGSVIQSIDEDEEPKRGQRAKIYPVDDCKIGDGWECQFCCSKCYEDFDGELPEGYCDDCDSMDI